MEFKIGEKIEKPVNTYRVVLTYYNRDDSMHNTHVHFALEKQNELEEFVTLLNQAIADLPFANGEKLPKDIPNFSKWFLFQNVEGRLSKELEKEFDAWEENSLEKFQELHWEEFEMDKIEGYEEEYEQGLQRMKNAWIEKYPHMKDDDQLLWDLLTCSGEVELVVNDYEVYWFDENGVEYKVEVK